MTAFGLPPLFGEALGGKAHLPVAVARTIVVDLISGVFNVIAILQDLRSPKSLSVTVMPSAN